MDHIVKCVLPSVMPIMLIPLFVLEIIIIKCSCILKMMFRNTFPGREPDSASYLCLTLYNSELSQPDTVICYLAQIQQVFSAPLYQTNNLSSVQLLASFLNLIYVQLVLLHPFVQFQIYFPASARPLTYRRPEPPLMGQL